MIKTLSTRALVAVAAAPALLVGLVVASAPRPAAAVGVTPTVTGLSRHSGVWWGGETITVTGTGFTKVRSVRFGSHTAWGLHVLSPTRLRVRNPEHGYGTIHVRVVTAAGTSAKRTADRFTFGRATMDTPIYGGLTARQEQRISAKVRRAHRSPHIAKRHSYWTPDMGLTALRRARSWLGLPYSWAGGNAHGPTRGVCQRNGGDNDCRVIGFDCSGLTLNAWSPYRSLAHYAQTQKSQAGSFHPSIGQLAPGDLVFFSAYIPNGIGHVGIYENRGMIIHASQSGTTVMRSRLTDVIAHSGTYRGAVRPMSTRRQHYAAPILSSVTPSVSARGGTIIVTGRGLDRAVSVTVGSAKVYSFARTSSTRIVLRAPAHASGTARVAVSNRWASSTSRPLTYIGAPTATSFAPASGPVTGGTTVTVGGRDLTPVTRVTVGSTAVPFTLSRGRLTFVSPAHTAGRVAVQLYSRYGTSAPRTFTYIASTPTPAPPTTTALTTTPPTTPPPTPPDVTSPAITAPGDHIGNRVRPAGR